MLSNNLILLSLAFTLVFISVSGALSMLYGLTPDLKKYKAASRYFAMGFICIGVLSFIVVFFPIEGKLENAIKLTSANICTFIGMYFFRAGFAKRSDHPLLNKELFLIHLAIYTVLTFALSSDEFLGDLPTIRVSLLNFNFIIILASMFPLVKIDRRGHASFGERVIYVTLTISSIMMLIYPIASSQTQSTTAYLLLTTPVQALQLHIWVTGLLVLMLSDVINIYRSLAIKDGMTGLFNRTHFIQSVQDKLDKFQYGALILCDLDHFKRINDTYGHSAGDQALQEFSQLLQTIGQQPNVVARFGGEEFAIFLPETNSSEAEIIAENLKAKTEHLCIQYEGNRFQFTASFGVCHISDQEALSESLKSADKALYRAKNSGRNMVCVYD